MEQKKRVLIVEDEKSIVDIIRFNLDREGYATLEAYDGEAGLALARSEKPDLILLDVMLPKMIGFDVCRALREEGDNVPVIILTAREEEEDKVLGLELGADDYITKPFSPSELTARIDAVYRRVSMSTHTESKSSVIESGPFTLNLKSRTVAKNGVNIDLTQVEYQILEYFMSNQNTALDRSSILAHIWGDTYVGADKIVDVNVRRIRMKIEEDPSNPKYIATIWGFGYKWSAGDEEEEENGEQQNNSDFFSVIGNLPR